MAHAPVTIICTGTYWRNAWKYHSRTYRHFGWDNGTILANLLAMSAASNLPARVIAGFVDSQVNALLGLDTKREVAFSLVPIGHIAVHAAGFASKFPLSICRSFLTPKTEVDYPAMRKMHEASSLESADEVAAVARQDAVARLSRPEGNCHNSLQPLDDSTFLRTPSSR